MLAFEDNTQSPAIIKVVGVGGAGTNAIERMAALNLTGVELIAMNTDEQVLRASSAHTKIHLGSKITRGMGAGAKPEIGAQAAVEDRDKIMNALKGADMVFITAGMGGGTGTGAAPIIAEVAHELKALTVGVISLPFKHEGSRKMALAVEGQNNLREKTDTLISIPNDAIFKVIERTTPVNVAFKALDDILAHSVMGISDIINSTGLVNVDFADVRTVMSQNGDALIGFGEGEGDSRINDALSKAIHHPLLEGRSIDGATAVLINITGGDDLSMFEYDEVNRAIQEQVAKDALIIVGFRQNAALNGRVEMTVIATGFRKKAIRFAEPAAEPEEFRSVSGGDFNDRAMPVRENGAPIDARYNYGAPREPMTFPRLDTDQLNIPTYMRKKR